MRGDWRDEAMRYEAVDKAILEKLRDKERQTPDSDTQAAETMRPNGSEPWREHRDRAADRDAAEYEKRNK